MRQRGAKRERAHGVDAQAGQPRHVATFTDEHTDTVLRGQAVLRDAEVLDGARGRYVRRSDELAARPA